MFTGKTPFTGKSDYWIFEQIKKGEIAPPENLDEDVKDLIIKLLVKDPASRLGAGVVGS